MPRCHSAALSLLADLVVPHTVAPHHHNSQAPLEKHALRCYHVPHEAWLANVGCNKGKRTLPGYICPGHAFNQQRVQMRWHTQPTHGTLDCTTTKHLRSCTKNGTRRFPGLGDGALARQATRLYCGAAPGARWHHHADFSGKRASSL